MKKGLKKAVVFGLSAGLALTSLAGCSKKDKLDTEATAITVNGDTVSAGVVNFAIRYSQAGFEPLYMSFGMADPLSQDMYGSGNTMGEDMKAQIVTQVRNAVLAEQKMDEYDVSLSDEDKEKIKAAAAAFIEANDEEVLENIGATPEVVERYLELITVQTRMETKMSADVDTEVSDEEAAQRQIQYTFFGLEAEMEESTEPVTEAATESGAASQTEKAAAETESEIAAEDQMEQESASLTKNEATNTQVAEETEAAETETTTETKSDTTEEVSEAAQTEAMTETEDPERAAARERARVHAEEMIGKLQAGEEFEAAAEEMGKGANTTTFGADYSITELVAATDGLEDDTLIETPVETSDGYYVVKLITQLDREATDNQKETIVNTRKQERISELYTEWENAGDISVDDKVMATITFDYHLTRPTEAQTDATVEVVTEAGTEAESETGSEADIQTEETELPGETDAQSSDTEAGETETTAE